MPRSSKYRRLSIHHTRPWRNVFVELPASRDSDPKLVRAFLRAEQPRNYISESLLRYMKYEIPDDGSPIILEWFLEGATNRKQAKFWIQQDNTALIVLGTAVCNQIVVIDNTEEPNWACPIIPYITKEEKARQAANAEAIRVRNEQLMKDQLARKKAEWDNANKESGKNEQAGSSGKPQTKP